VMVGHHGETVLRLMKPGFHSGTLPKLYNKLRRAERKGYRYGQWRKARKLREEIHHVEASVRHFVERELLVLLNTTRGWQAGAVEVGELEAGSNRIRLELGCAALGGPSLVLQFEEQSGWLLAHVARPGWLAKVSPEEVRVLRTALAGFYKMGGVNLLREQIEASFPPACPPYDIADEGLVVWPGQGYGAEVVYDLHTGPEWHPHVTLGQPPGPMPVLRADQLLLDNVPVPWWDWVEAWERDQAGKEPGPPLLDGIHVLPRLDSVV